MLSHTYSQSSRTGYEAETEHAVGNEPARLGARTQLWLAFATVLLATWATWSASVWLLADWQLR